MGSDVRPSLCLDLAGQASESMNAPGYNFKLTCADCSGQLSHISNAVPTSLESKARAVCNDCGRDWLITVRMFLMPSSRIESNKAALAGSE